MQCACRPPWPKEGLVRVDWARSRTTTSSSFSQECPQLNREYMHLSSQRSTTNAQTATCPHRDLHMYVYDCETDVGIAGLLPFYPPSPPRFSHSPTIHRNRVNLPACLISQSKPSTWTAPIWRPSQSAGPNHPAEPRQSDGLFYQLVPTTQLNPANLQAFSLLSPNHPAEPRQFASIFNTQSQPPSWTAPICKPFQ